MKKKRKISKTRRVVNLLILLLIPVVFYSCVDSMIFYPPAVSYRPSSHQVDIPVENGQSIAAFHLPASAGSPVVLFSHGNAEDIGHCLPFLQHYHMQDFGILAYDYRGYGLSDGKPSEQNTYCDIAAAYRYLINDQQIDPARIIIHGRSVGSGPSVWLAAQQPVGGLILESPFVSAFRVRTRWKILPFDKYDNLARIKHVQCPVLIIHGQADRIVGFWHSQTLLQAANEPKMHYWVPNAGHNNLIDTAGQEYWKTLNTFKNTVYQTETTVSDVD